MLRLVATPLLAGARVATAAQGAGGGGGGGGRRGTVVASAVKRGGWLARVGRRHDGPAMTVQKFNNQGPPNVRWSYTNRNCCEPSPTLVPAKIAVRCPRQRPFNPQQRTCVGRDG